MKRRKRDSKTLINFILQLEVSGKSPYWSILKYYQQLEKDKVRQMLVEAATVFWQPLVDEEITEKDNSQREQRELKKSTYQLQQQILYFWTLDKKKGY